MQSEQIHVFLSVWPLCVYREHCYQHLTVGIKFVHSSTEPIRAADNVDGGGHAGAGGPADGAPQRGVPGAAGGGRRQADPAARAARHRRLHRAAGRHCQLVDEELQAYKGRLQ